MNMEFFGLIAFCMAAGLYAKVHHLERILRDNGITAKGAVGLGDQLRRQVGQTVELALDDSDGDIMGDITGRACRVLDVDETWALVLANEGKKNECRKLIRLDNVKQIKVK